MSAISDLVGGTPLPSTPPGGTAISQLVASPPKLQIPKPIQPTKQQPVVKPKSNDSFLDKTGHVIAGLFHSTAQSTVKPGLSLAQSANQTAAKSLQSSLQDFAKLSYSQRVAKINSDKNLAANLKLRGIDPSNPSDESIQKILSKAKSATKQPVTYTPTSPIEKKVFGDNKGKPAPITTYQTDEQSVKKGLGNTKLAPIATPLALGLTGAEAAVDVAPGPSGSLLKEGVKAVVPKAARSFAGETGAKLAAATAPYVNPVDAATRKVIGKAVTGTGKIISKLPGGATAIDKLTATKNRLATSMVEHLHPLFNVVDQAEKKGLVAKGTKNQLDLLRGNVAGSARETKNFIDHNPAFQKLQQSVADLNPNTKQAIKDFGDYANAKREMQLIDQGRKGGKAASSERYQAFQEQVNTLRAKYGDGIETARKNLVESHAELSKLLSGNGLSEKELEDYARTDPEYIRLQRKLSDYRINGPFVNRGTGANTAQQKINKFAKQEALGSLETLYDRAYKVHSFVNSNNLKLHAIKAAKESGLGVEALRTTEKVLNRREAMRFLEATHPASHEVDRLVKTHSRELRILQTQLDKLNKRGLDIRLKDRKSVNNDLPILSGNRQVLRSVRKVTNPLRDIPKLSGTIADVQFSRKITNNETRKIVSNLISTDPSGIARIKHSIGNREPKVKELINRINDLRSQAEAFHSSRSEAYKEILKNKDLVPHGEAVVSAYSNGIKNIYKFDDPTISNAINNYNRIQSNAFFDSVKTLNNVFKYGTTQGNPAFAIPNLIRDLVTSGITSESLWRTHNPLTIISSLRDAVIHAGGGKVKDPLAKDFFNNIGSSNFIDVNRNLKKAAEEVAGSINSKRSTIGKIQNITIKKAITKPFLKADDFINALENSTRLQNYKGTYRLYRSKGYSEEGARSAALLAARRNTVDFSASGDFGKFLNSWTPYLNAGIQGIRTLGRAVKERPATVTAKLVAAASPVVALSYWNLSDPNRAKIYANVPQYIRDGNFVIVTPSKKVITIPMSQEVQATAGVFRRLQEARFGYDPTSFIGQGRQFLNAMSPISARNPADYVASFTPPLAKTTLELYANHSFYTGQQIVPDNLRAINPNPADQKYASTPAIANLIGKGLNVSPLQVAYAAKGSVGSSTASAALTGGTGVPGLVANRFAPNNLNDVQNQFNNIYYPLKDATQTRRNYIYGLIKDGKVQQAQRMANEYNSLVDQSFAKYYREYGQYTNSNNKDKIGKLKIQIVTSARTGKPYVKF